MHESIAIELYRHLFSSVAEEMGAALCRTAFSPNIKERRDYSCALFDAHGRMIAQAAHIPVHLGAMPASVQAAMHAINFAPGDAVLLNDPYAGGTHLPDLTLVTSVFLSEAREQPIGFVASRAHHADVGGMAPGSLPLARELVQEGLIIPPVRLLREGQAQEDIVAIVCRNSRTPDERRGDLEAQIAAGQLGEKRLLELFQRYGAATIDAEARRLMDYSERRVRAVVAELPRGAVSFRDVLDGDGRGSGPLALCVTVEAKGDTLVVDFEGTAPECDGSLNAVESITRSAVLYVVQCLAGDSVPMNHGCLAPLDIRCPLGSLVNAHPGRALSAGNVETSQRIVDVLFGALAQLAPKTVPAASQGTMNNVMIGGWDTKRGRPFTYYETIAGGMGARPTLDGLSGVQVHMTNTLNTPVEALELSYPLRVAEYRIRRGSGGDGMHRGGDGVVRATQLLDAAVITLVTERREHRPYGLQGGQPGAMGANWLLSRGQSHRESLPGKVTIDVPAGDTIVVETPGGGGWGVDSNAVDDKAVPQLDLLGGDATGSMPAPS